MFKPLFPSGSMEISPANPSPTVRPGKDFPCLLDTNEEGAARGDAPHIRSVFRSLGKRRQNQLAPLAAASPFLSANQNFGQARHLSLVSAVSAHSLESLVEQASCRYHASGDRNLGKANIRQEASYSVVVCG
jgi:hypothetical protein